MLIKSGLALIITGVVTIGAISYPVLLAEVNYRFIDHHIPAGPTAPQSNQFQIIIPKLNISSPVLPNIDPFNKNQYTDALKKGVAQALGSSLPGESGNIFIFAHSTDSPLNIFRYNAVFYLLNKLTINDEIDLLYSGKTYKYIVNKTNIVKPAEVKYLQPVKTGHTLTLMTCWPPGTTLQRLLVTSHLAI